MEAAKAAVDAFDQQQQPEDGFHEAIGPVDLHECPNAAATAFEVSSRVKESRLTRALRPPPPAASGP